MSKISANISVVIYRFTGQQGFFTVPQRYCPECDLTIAVTQKVVNALQPKTNRKANLMVKPWFLYFWEPLLYGGWHAPIVTVNGRVISQGVVPPAETIENALSNILQNTSTLRED